MKDRDIDKMCGTGYLFQQNISHEAILNNCQSDSVYMHTSIDTSICSRTVGLSVGWIENTDSTKWI